MKRSTLLRRFTTAVAATAIATSIAVAPATAAAPDAPSTATKFGTIVAAMVDTSAAPKATTPVVASANEPSAPYTASSSTAKRKSRKAELAEARRILRGLIAKHPELRGATVTIGATPGGYQAVAYYQSGRIVINPKHRASLKRILNHEVWHIIDYRDNGRIDWGENVPPRQ